MLVLSRKQEQSIHIGDAIVVTVLGVRGSTVKLGIEAPRDIRIVRSELPSHTVERPPPAAVHHSPLHVAGLPRMQAPPIEEAFDVS